MTPRLQNALRRLPPEKIEALADFAEFLATREGADMPDGTDRMTLAWAGALADERDRYASGVDLAHAISRERAAAPK